MQPPISNAPETVHADVGVLLIHGIGDHRQGETLTSFGEPLVNWLDQWLRGAGGAHSRGKATVTHAQLSDKDEVACATVEVTAPGHIAGQAPATERWLFAEGWWGDAVRPPQSLHLLTWMFTRGPLLIYWHFYVRGAMRRAKGGGHVAEEEMKDEHALSNAAHAVVALLLAGICQLFTSVAMLLWLIPIGPLRRGVVAAVRALTLTLGDSYVLLEQEIQRAALVDRTRRSLAWLAARAKRIVVIAHSQGGAIAHESLRRDTSGKIAMFISIGSGLEKLLFLRVVFASRSGLMSAALLFPLVAIGAGTAISGFAEGIRWQQVIGIAFAFGGIMVAGVLLAAFREYRKEKLATAINDLRLPGLPQARQWVDLYASHDVVPMGSGSLLISAPFVARGEVCNERSFLRDHVSYFESYTSSLAQIWRAMARVSSLRLIDRKDRGRLRRFARVHNHFARVVSYCGFGIVIATLIGAVVLRHDLLGFGESVIRGAKGSAFEDWLKPFQALADFLARVAMGVGIKAASDPELMAKAMFGGVVLVGAILLWWLGVRGFWRARCAVRWRQACHGGDLMHTTSSRVWHWTGAMAFLVMGLLPLIVVVTFWIAPGALTANAVGNAGAGILSLLSLLYVAVYAGGGPWIMEMLWNDEKEPLRYRLFIPFVMLLVVTGFLFLARWAWPYPVSERTAEGFVAGTYFTMGLGWQVFAVVKLRKRIGAGWLVLLTAIPIFGTLAAQVPTGWSRPWPDVAGIYFLLTVLVLLAVAVILHRSILPRQISLIRRRALALFRLLRSSARAQLRQKRGG